MLVRENLISVEQLRLAQALQKEHGGRIAGHLIGIGAITGSQLAEFLAGSGPSYVNLDEFQIAPEIISLVPAWFVEKYRILPLNQWSEGIIIGVEGETDRFAIDELRRITGKKIESVLIVPGQLLPAIARYYGAQLPPDWPSDVWGAHQVVSRAGEPPVNPAAKAFSLIDTVIVQTRAELLIAKYDTEEFQLKFCWKGGSLVLRPPLSIAGTVMSQLSPLANGNASFPVEGDPTGRKKIVILEVPTDRVRSLVASISK